MWFKHMYFEFNGALGPQFMVRSENRVLQVIPKQPPIDTVVVQVEGLRFLGLSGRG